MHTVVERERELGLAVGAHPAGGPPGSEAERLGIDDGLAELLAPAPAPAPADDLWLLDPWPSEESREGE